MKYLKVWTSFRSVIKPLSDAEKGRLFEMMLQYADDGTEPGNFVGNELFTWPAAKQMLDLMMEENARLTENGRKGGRPKTRENQTKPTETNKNQLEPTKTQKENKYKEKERNEIENNLFSTFWAAYPRHVNKAGALKAFQKIHPDEGLLETMLQSIERSRNSTQWQENNGQYIPHPATWLNQRRWEDDPPVKVSAVPIQSYAQRDYAGEQEEAMMRMIRGVTA